ncbi:MAG TPA: acyl-CoA dehydrogenase, partial [Balneolaceae bacterium]|nr:acyl-CoA dehydrogenase [Balneolaceae bacterium]
IFEGSNDILYQQITESVLKMMRKLKKTNLQDFLSEFHLTERSSEYFSDILNFEVDAKMPQRKLVDLGKVIGRIISMEFTLTLGDQGFNSNLVENAVQTLKEEASAIVETYKNGGNAEVVEDYKMDSSWLKFVTVNA